MTTFRKVRELLLTMQVSRMATFQKMNFYCCMMSTDLKTADFPYQNYEHFDLERPDEKMSDIIHWTSI